MLRTAMNSDKDLLAIAYRQTEKALAKAKKDMSTLEEEAIKALTGDGAYSFDVINKLYCPSNSKSSKPPSLKSIDSPLKNAELEQRMKHTTDIERIYTWADSFSNAPFDQKRVIIAAIVEKVSVSDVDHIEVGMKLTARQYLSEGEENKEKGDGTRVI